MVIGARVGDDEVEVELTLEAFANDVHVEKAEKADAEAEAVDPVRIAAFFESSIGKRAAAAEELHKEAPFILRTVLDGRTVFVQGVIDCYFREGDSYVLIDYKSNYVDKSDPGSEKERLREHYEPQLELYREALERILGVDVKESVLYLFGLDDTVSVSG